MINILIRTHDRPEKLKECIKSIENQTYKDWRIIISADNDKAEKWTKPYGYEYIRTDKIRYKKRIEKSRMKKEWNRYLNALQGRATEGFIMYMDEDMVLYTENSLQLVANNSHEDRLLIYKYKIRQDIGIRPEKGYWRQTPQRTHISTGCFSHPAKHKVRWRGISAGDYFSVSNLYNRLKTTWLDEIILMGQAISDEKKIKKGKRKKIRRNRRKK